MPWHSGFKIYVFEIKLIKSGVCEASETFIELYELAWSYFTGRLTFDVLLMEATTVIQHATQLKLQADQILMHFNALISGDLLDIIASAVTIEGGATLNSSGRGFEKNTGPGAGNFILGSGGHHGGYGGGITSLNNSNGVIFVCFPCLKFL